MKVPDLLGHTICLKLQTGKPAINKSKTGSIEVPEGLSYTIREDIGIK